MKINNPNYLNGLSSSASEIDAVVGSATTNVKTYYVSNNGLDTNNGLTHLTSFKTIAKALTLISDYTTLKFECGSVFYEPLVYNNSDLTFESYGVGNKPVIDGSSVIATPTLVSGNVYTTTNTYTTTQDGRVTIYEDGVPMQPVGTQAECEALPNSYVTSTYDSIVGGTYSTMFHTSDSNPPLTNGKEYRTNTHDCIRALNANTNRDNIKVSNIEARYGFYGTSIALSHGYNNIVDNCYGRYGNKHNIFISANGIGKNLVAYGAELQGEYGRTATLFVAYHSAPVEGSTYTWENCVAIQDLKKSGKVQGLDNVAFIDHAGIGTFAKSTFNNCYIRGVAAVFATRTDVTNINNCYAEKISAKVLSNNGGITSIKNSFFQRNFIGNSTNEQGKVTYKNTTFINHVYADCSTATINLDNCLFYGGNSIKYQSYMMGTSGSSGALSLKMYNTIIFGYQNFTHGVVGTAYVGNYNVITPVVGSVKKKVLLCASVK